MKKRAVEKKSIIDWCIIAVVVIVGIYSVAPMVLLGDDYVFTIHDNLDHYAAYIQYVHDNNLFFRLFDDYPLMGGIPGYYFLSYLSYGISGTLGWLFGYRLSQIIIRIIGVVLGYFSAVFFFRQISNVRNTHIDRVSRIIAIIYAVMPISPIRTLSFAIMPFIAGFFIMLAKDRKFRKKSFLPVVFPFFSYFNSLTIFAIAFWGAGCIIDWIKHKKSNPNLVVSLASYILGTVISDFPILYLVLHSSETNRSLHFSPTEFNFRRFRELLRFGQYHAASYHHYVLLWCVGIGIIYLTVRYVLAKKKKRTFTDGKAILFLWIGIVSWIIASFIQAYSETNRKTGFLLIDGFQWGRIIGWGRFLWLSMFVVVVQTIIANSNSIPFRRTDAKFAFYSVRFAVGMAIFAALYYAFHLLFGDMGFPDSWSSFLPEKIKHIINIIRWFAVGLFTIGVFWENRKVLIMGTCFVVLIHGVFILTTQDSYSDTTRSVYYYLNDTKDNESISFGEFYDKALFESIKEDIHYSDEGVAAYGFEPSVLLFNGFRTVDGYLSVHPMKNQEEFRKIISPYLDTDAFFENYYDNWGGRMYLFGELGSESTRNKEREPSKLLIDTDAFLKFGGRYIFSGAQIMNADELHLQFVKEYTRPDSIYHLYLYQAE